MRRWCLYKRPLKILLRQNLAFFVPDFRHRSARPIRVLLFHMYDPLPSKPTSRGQFAVRDEFLNTDFPSVGAMYDFASQPFMTRVTKEILEPLRMFYRRIHDDLERPEAEGKRSAMDRHVLRQRVRDFLEMSVSPVDLTILPVALVQVGR